MIQRQTLLNDLKGLLKRLETDLRDRAEPGGETPEIHLSLTTAYEKARTAERTAATFEEWRAEQMTQKAVAWILSCVFSRFLEDNGLIDPPRISGPGDRLKRARDEHELYFREHPLETDREYLLSCFDVIAGLPGGGEIFGRHNAIHIFPGWLSGDAAGALLVFFQKINAGTGELVHDFTDPDWDTRFLGDLYQDLSEAARKKYALLQTPDFVEEFILDRTLEPALDEFGLDAPPVKNRDGDEIAPAGFRMIDPACGSGHFLLGSFDRIFERWLRKAPSGNSRDLAQRTLDSIHGVDINPFAVAIARFRLLLRAMRASGIKRLKDCPDFRLNIACGDSLLHGEGAMQQMGLAFEPMAHCYETEDDQELGRILRIGIYHAVVANPPYITPKDPQQNKNMRKRYGSCYGKYALNVPFMERIFHLNIKGYENKSAGFNGQITANSFMKREFGKKLIEKFVPRWDLTHVIDTSGAYIPGHGTPTVILFGRSRKPISNKVRLLMGILGEPTTPENPKNAKVWSKILELVDKPASESAYISTQDADRAKFGFHPWTIGGGGVDELKDILESSSDISLSAFITAIGPASFPGVNEMFIAPNGVFQRNGISKEIVRPLCIGEGVRDWLVSSEDIALVPYNADQKPLTYDLRKPWCKYLWYFRTCSEGMISFGKKTRRDLGHDWWSWYRWIPERYKNDKVLVFSEIATHNHFAVACPPIAFTQTAPVIVVSEAQINHSFYTLLGLLNSSAACFWLKQVCHNKGSSVDDKHARQSTVPFEDFYAFNGTRLKEFPICENHPIDLTKRIHALAISQQKWLPYVLLNQIASMSDSIEFGRQKFRSIVRSTIFLQEELDWEVYKLYGLLDEALAYDSVPIEIELGQRAFEMVMARKMVAGELETTWFERHNSTPITEIPAHWPDEYKQLVERRIRTIEENPRTIGLIEQPEYKRRWNLEPWDSQLEKALRNWLLDRLESYFDFDGRMNGAGDITAKMDIGLTTTARLSDIARSDEKFMEVATLYRKRSDFDVAVLVAELVEAESVPLLPACRYKPTGMDKRTAWERTWRLQRIEDDIDMLFDAQRLAEIDGDEVPQVFKKESSELVGKIKEVRLSNNSTETTENQAWLYEQVLSAFYFVASEKEEGQNLDTDRIKQYLSSLSKAAKDRLVGDNPVPPKYTTKDFLNTVFWRLRGKLDVPKERWVSFPHCSGEDPSLLIAWTGYDHLQLAGAIAAHYMEIKEKTGGSDDPRLEVLLACLIELLPWLKQWHNDLDPEFHERMGDFYEAFITEEARQMGNSVDEVRWWMPPQPKRGRQQRS